MWYSVLCVALLSLAEPQTVDSVDLQRYAGLWYEIARYPMWFEKGMTHVTAEYIPQGDYIRVINRGIKNGKPKEAKGKGFVVDNSGNAKLKIQFFWPFKGDYWIIDLDPAYQWVVISNKKRSTLWILSRTPQMDSELLNRLLRQLAADGFALQKIEMTIQ